ncbi:hypothetical protein [uncultured Amnibacterium sp.]|uniref:hypothetical protein n=1 Tax=uncultured Amnibacterium sp. TaxID=1631851 RepID=UPI0035C9E6FA
MSSPGRPGRPAPRATAAETPSTPGTVIRGLSLFAALIAGVIFVLLRDVVLPARFSYDADGIQAIGQGKLHVVDPAYQSVAAVYRTLGLVDDATAAALLGYLAAFAVLAVAGRRLLRPDAPLSATILFFGSVMLSAVYLGTYSKDVFVLPIVLLAVLPGGRLRWPILTGLAVIAYALTFRTYWFVVLAMWLALQVVLSRRPRVIWVLVTMLLASVLLAAAIGVAVGQSADSFRATTNEGRLDSADAASAIVPFIGGGTLLTGMINMPLTLVSLLAPVPLVLKGGVYFLALAALLTAFWTRTGIGVHRSLRAGPDPAERSRIALLLAFVLVQAVFEPDYGSALRHITPLLPIAVSLWSIAAPSTAKTRPFRKRPATVRVVT